jgi:predicted RNase H-like HicB family nuclease
MLYPIVIEPGDDTKAFGVIVPDLPGCFSAGDTLWEAIVGAREAIAAWIGANLDAGRSIPGPSSLEDIRQNSYLAGPSLVYSVAVEVDDQPSG